MRCILAKIPTGTHLLQAGITNNTGFFASMRLLARAKFIEIFEFLNYLEASGNLIDDSKLIAMLSVKDSRTRMCSISQRLLVYENVQIMTFNQISAKKNNISNSKSS